MDLLAPGYKYNVMASVRAKKVKCKLLVISDFSTHTIASCSSENLLDLQEVADGSHLITLIVPSNAEFKV